MLKLSDFKKYSIESELRKICGGVGEKTSGTTKDGKSCDDFIDKCDVTTSCDGTEKSDQKV